MIIILGFIVVHNSLLPKTEPWVLLLQPLALFFWVPIVLQYLLI